jgi:hypothetical protein
MFNLNVDIHLFQKENDNIENFCKFTQGTLIVEGGFQSTQRYYRIFLFLYFLLSCYMFRSYDHLHAEIYLPEITLLDSWLLC